MPGPISENQLKKSTIRRATVILKLKGHVQDTQVNKKSANLN